MVGTLVPRSAAASTAFLFDLDDTLFDHALTCRRAIELVREETPVLQRRTSEALWADYLAWMDGPRASTGTPPTTAEMRDGRWRRLLASCGADWEARDVRALSARYRSLYLDHRRPVPGAVELVRALHLRAPVGIVTNNELAEQEEKLRFLGLGGAVDALVVSEAVGISKPDPEIFAEALRRLGAPAASAVMVGDSWTNDVQGAHGAGLRAVWFNRFGLPRPQPGPVAELRSFLPVENAEAVVRAHSEPGPAAAGARP